MKPPHYRWAFAAALLAAGCSHSDQFEFNGPQVGAFNTGADVRLTVNPNQDYWPEWTQDGKGILYSFIRDVPGSQHRCLGLMPPGGGTRTWELCDNRATQTDSTSSFTAYALGSDGQLIYTEAVGRAGIQSSAPSQIKLWLADTAAPLQRRQLLSLPTFVGTTGISWLAEITWTSPTTFLALAQDFSILGHCNFCGPVDSIFTGLGVVSGTITATGATLQFISGTTGATGYSLAENGASIAFIVRDDRRLFKVPVSGGAVAIAVAPVTLSGTGQLTGVSCKGTTCIVANAPLNLTTVTPTGITFGFMSPTANSDLRTVSLATATVTVVKTLLQGLLVTPKISPTSSDVVVQTGGNWGHLQTFTSSTSDLHLYQGLVQ